MMTFYDKHPEPMAVPGLPVPEEGCSLDLWVGTDMSGWTNKRGKERQVMSFLGAMSSMFRGHPATNYSTLHGGGR